jgi:hypothetical protein
LVKARLIDGIEKKPRALGTGFPCLKQRIFGRTSQSAFGEPLDRRIKRGASTGAQLRCGMLEFFGLAACCLGKQDNPFVIQQIGPVEPSADLAAHSMAKGEVRLSILADGDEISL